VRDESKLLLSYMSMMNSLNTFNLRTKTYWIPNSWRPLLVVLAAGRHKAGLAKSAEHPSHWNAEFPALSPFLNSPPHDSLVLSTV